MTTFYVLGEKFQLREIDEIYCMLRKKKYDLVKREITEARSSFYSKEEKYQNEDFEQKQKTLEAIVDEAMKRTRKECFSWAFLLDIYDLDEDSFDKRNKNITHSAIDSIYASNIQIGEIADETKKKMAQRAEKSAQKEKYNVFGGFGMQGAIRGRLQSQLLNFGSDMGDLLINTIFNTGDCLSSRSRITDIIKKRKLREEGILNALESDMEHYCDGTIDVLICIKDQTNDFNTRKENAIPILHNIEKGNIPNEKIGTVFRDLLKNFPISEDLFAQILLYFPEDGDNIVKSVDTLGIALKEILFSFKHKKINPVLKEFTQRYENLRQRDRLTTEEVKNIIAKKEECKKEVINLFETLPSEWQTEDLRNAFIDSFERSIRDDIDFYNIFRTRHFINTDKGIIFGDTVFKVETWEELLNYCEICERYDKSKLNRIISDFYAAVDKFGAAAESFKKLDDAGLVNADNVKEIVSQFNKCKLLVNDIIEEVHNIDPNGVISDGVTKEYENYIKEVDKQLPPDVLCSDIHVKEDQRQLWEKLYDIIAETMKGSNCRSPMIGNPFITESENPKIGNLRVVCNIPTGANIFFANDETILGSWKAGWAFCDTGIYRHTAFLTKSLSWEQFMNCKLTPNPYSASISVDDDTIGLLHDCEAVCKALKKWQEVLHTISQVKGTEALRNTAYVKDHKAKQPNNSEAEVKKCTHCGKEIKKEAHFCNFCGSQQ
ncbi:MAG: zinc ribbon domain-containing protein [Lachnospiraceae bacterium]|nr:zinc ribbon domain-containing protein [Lachnospiraceae bacterium]